MTSVLDAPWFYWAVGVAIGFPICLVLLTELQNALRRRGSCSGPAGSPAAHLHPAARSAADPAGAGRCRFPARRHRCASSRRCSASSSWCCCCRVLNATLFQGAPEGTWRKRIPSIFLDVARFALIAIGVGADLRLHLGRARRRPVHRAGCFVDRARPDAAELRRADHLRPARAVRAAVSARRLDRNADGARTGGGSQLARNAYRHRQRSADHAELGARRRVVHQLQPAAGRPLPRRDHGVLARRPARRRLRDAEPGGRHAAAAAARRGAVERPRGRPAVQARRSRCARRPTTSPPSRCSCAGFGMPRGAPGCTSTRPRTTSPPPSGWRLRCASSLPRCG